MLADHFNLPIVNISSKEKYIKNIDKHTYYITNTEINSNIIPSYSIIMNNEVLRMDAQAINAQCKYQDIHEMIIKTKIYQQIK